MRPISPSWKRLRKQLKAKGRRAPASNSRRWHSSCAPASRRCSSSRCSIPRSMRSGENLVYKKYMHIGFAADTPNGLLVPVIRDADRKDIYEIARALAELSEKARAGKLIGGRDAGRQLHHLQPGRHRRHGVHADHQCAGSRDPRRVARQSCKPVYHDGALRAAADAAAVAVLRSSRDRWRQRRALHQLIWQACWPMRTA